MSDIYAVTFEMEMLREFAASLDARYWRYIDKHGLELEDKENPIVAYNGEIVDISEAVLSCDTLDELEVIKKRLKELRSIFEGLEEER